MMPPTGSHIFAGAFKIKDGSGGPVRIFAIFGDDVSSGSLSNKMATVLLPLMLFCVARLVLKQN